MDPIARVRRFNRTVTLRAGALASDFLGRKRPLGASRVLFEIGTGGIEVRDLRARLALDSGYASRLLRGLEREGLVRTRPAAADRRTRIASLTAAGRRELATLDRLSDAAAGAILESVDPARHTALLDAMATVENLLLGSEIAIAVEPPASRDAKRCVARYFAELATRFPMGFDPARSIPLDTNDLAPPSGYFLIARLRGEPVGCGALRCHADFGEIKRMWVSPAARGLGIARRILHQLEALARSAKVPKLRLETNGSLVEARALYASSGYREVPAFNDEPYAQHWFEKDLE